MTGREIVAEYFKRGYRPVFWPAEGDLKGPTEKGWTTKPYTLEDYHEGDRVGLLTGVEISSGRFLLDVDLDWQPGSLIAQSLLPLTSFVYGRASKRISHCFYTTSEPLPSYRYEDVDKTCLIELRGTKSDGSIGLQSMVPPSIWSKEGAKEVLEFIKSEGPTHVEILLVKTRVCYAAIAQILAKHLGHNGFGHEARLCWAGFLLRAGIEPEDLIMMGEAIGVYCNNTEVTDVRRTVESTLVALEKDGKKVKGAPSLARLIGKQGRAVVNRINEWLGRNEDFKRDKEGKILKDHQGNIRFAIQLLGYELSYQEFSERMMITIEGDPRKVPIDDRIMNTMWLRIDRELFFRPTFSFFERVVYDIVYENRYHPVRDYLLSLKWDGRPRINTWLVDYGGATEDDDHAEEMTYLEAVSSIVLIAAVRRVMKPGCKYDEMLVLESGQGIGKSSALRALCPEEEWFSDDLPLDCDAKEIIERTLGKWIIEASDLVGGRKADRDHLKSMLSRQIDGPARMAYARTSVERPRHFIVVGTTNSSQYIEDGTGGRRFWPVMVQKFELDLLARDRDQLWAEAVVREAAGETIRLPERLWLAAEKHQEQRREVDAWEQVIRDEISMLDPKASGRLQIAAEVLWVAVGVTDIARRDRLGAKRIAEAMQRFGFRRTNVRNDEGKLVTGYVKDPQIKPMEEVTPDNSVAETLIENIKSEL